MARSNLINLLLFILIVVAAWFGVWSGWQKTGDIRESIGALERSVEEETAAIQKLAELERLTKLRSAEIAKLEIAVSPRRDPASLIAAFEDAASVNGLALDGLDVFEADSQSQTVPTGSPEAAPGEVGSAIFKTLNARIQLTGRYLAFQSFLADLEKSFPLVDPANITFQRPLEGEIAEGAAPLNPVLAFTVTLEGYYLEE